MKYSSTYIYGKKYMQFIQRKSKKEKLIFYTKAKSVAYYRIVGNGRMFQKVYITLLRKQFLPFYLL